MVARWLCYVHVAILYVVSSFVIKLNKDTARLIGT